MIDWGAAQRIGELVAGLGSDPARGGSIRADLIEPRAHEFAARVASYSLLEPREELPALELVDRPAWIAANLHTMRPMLAPLTDRLGDEHGMLAGPLRSVSGLMLGAQVGALTGMLSQRVLGQYDVALLDPEVAPRLLLLAPNLAQAAGNLAVDRDELVLWVTIHEITHAVQFGGAPWLRGYIGGLLAELIEALQISLPGAGQESEHGKPPAPPNGAAEASANGGAGGGRGGLFGLPWGGLDTTELRAVLERARSGQILRLTLGEDRWQLVERMQAAMSLIEGHAEHTMDAVGAEVLPSLPRLRRAMDRRRSNRGLPWRVLERLLGLELKLRQYETGRRFCDAVVAAGGPQALALAWQGPEALPSPQELEQPGLWIARMGVAAA